MNYYNEFDQKAAAWLRELIKAGLIPQGEVDERSIVDVRGADLAGYTQCHFFAGIGGWSKALQLAGWPDDKPVWTGSCPCQPFSAAGKKKAQSDERHLWPHMFRLIRECPPATVFGEQVEGAVRLGWLDGVCGDLEAEGYAVGAHVLGAHSVGSPHIRQRLYWVAKSNRTRRVKGWPTPKAAGYGNTTESDGGSCGLAHPTSIRREREQEQRSASVQHAMDGEAEALDAVGTHGTGACGLGNAVLEGRAGQPLGLLGASHQGSWSNFDLIPCLDGKARRVESGTFPLADGVPARVVRLRGYGNAIVPQVAAEFVKAFLETVSAED